MRAHYDFSKMKGKKNPYVKYLKQPVTINLDRDSNSVPAVREVCRPACCRQVATVCRLFQISSRRIWHTLSDIDQLIFKRLCK